MSIDYESFIVVLTDHLKHNMQMCPYCLPNAKKNKTLYPYHVVWKKKVSEIMDLWRCKKCKKTFKLPNKYQLVKMELEKHR